MRQLMIIIGLILLASSTSISANSGHNSTASGSIHDRILSAASANITLNQIHFNSVDLRSIIGIGPVLDIKTPISPTDPPASLMNLLVGLTSVSTTSKNNNTQGTNITRDLAYHSAFGNISLNDIESTLKIADSMIGGFSLSNNGISPSASNIIVPGKGVVVSRTIPVP